MVEIVLRRELEYADKINAITKLMANTFEELVKFVATLGYKNLASKVTTCIAVPATNYGVITCQEKILVKVFCYYWSKFISIDIRSQAIWDRKEEIVAMFKELVGKIEADEEIEIKIKYMTEEQTG